MNKLFILSFFLLFSLLTSAQDISGDWTGEVEIPSGKLGFVFHLAKEGNGYSATMDIPKQGLNNSKAESTTYIDSVVTINFQAFKIEYSGRLNKQNEFIGNLSQSKSPVPLNLKRGNITLNRPQEPKPPFSYNSEEITFQSQADKINLKGTLTLPKKQGKYPVVIIISGSGPQDRNGAMFGHKLYWVIADQLTKNGIGVLRFDDRGAGESGGKVEETTIDVNSADVKGAIAYLKTRKDIITSKIGLLGHSIGGIIAPKVASETKDINYIVLMAGPGLDGDKLMLSQKAASERLLGLQEMQIMQGQILFGGAYNVVVNSKSDAAGIKAEVTAYFKEKIGTMVPKSQIDAITEQITGNEILSLIQSKPSIYLSKVKCPVLAINGSKDFQVPAKDNLAAIKSAVESNGNTKVKVMELENLNHLFQEAKTGALSEYAEIEQTISPVALNAMTLWIMEQVK
jgi:alpha/beta superfamily hydrolase